MAIAKTVDSGLSDYNENIAYINLKTLETFFNKKKDYRFLERRQATSLICRSIVK